MFTGIIESAAIIESVVETGTNRTFWLSSPISGQFKVDQSISHNGVCLTVEALATGKHQVTAINETLQKTDLSQWQPGKIVNLERSMLLDSRLDGHIVQGHVDTTAKCILIQENEGSWLIRFTFPDKFASLVIEKGSICINGISLTVFDVTDQELSVAIIPYTWQHTNMHRLSEGDTVNFEFDMVGKYINRIHKLSAR
jgi:riboflavin synthase